MLRYTIWGVSSYYIVPSGTEETLFGNGVTLKVTMSWDGSMAKLFLNDTLIRQTAYVIAHTQLDRCFGIRLRRLRISDLRRV